MTETIPIPDPDWADGLEGGTYVSLSHGPVTVRFLQEVPHKRENQWGKPAWDWEVELIIDGEVAGERVLSTTSTRLLRQLAKLRPLMGDPIRIIQDGEGMKTNYLVRRVSWDGNIKLELTSDPNAPGAVSMGNVRLV